MIQRVVPAGLGRVIVAVLAGIFLLFILFPLAALLLHTPPATLLSSLGQDSATSALLLSLETTGVTLLVVVLFGTPCRVSAGAWLVSWQAHPG